jgi:predicted nuclease with TOPRIM domain
MHRELFSLLADKAVAAGFAVCRFNWRFYESDPLAGQPSSALQDELEQLKEVIGQLRQNHAYCQRKCMSSENHSVASCWQALRDDAELKSGVLMTPLFDEMQDGQPCDVTDTYYPGLLAESRPLQIIKVTMILIARLLAAPYCGSGCSKYHLNTAAR